MRSYGAHYEALQLVKRLKDEATRAELREIRDAQAAGQISDQEAARRFGEVVARLRGKNGANK